MYNKMSNIHVNKDKIRCDSKQKQIKSNTRWEVEFLAKTSEHTMVSSFEKQTAEISSSSSAELETVQKKNVSAHIVHISRLGLFLWTPRNFRYFSYSKRSPFFRDFGPVEFINQTDTVYTCHKLVLVVVSEIEKKNK